MAWLALANAVTDKKLGVASLHSHGKLPITLGIDRAFEEKFDFESGQIFEPEPSCEGADP